MGETWIICRHVMDGSAEQVELRKDKICLCSECAEDIDIVNTEEVFILDEDRLEYTLHHFSHVDGLRHFGKARDPHGRIIKNKRSGKDRRSANPMPYTGSERRNLKYRRRGDDRRVRTEE